MHQTLVSNFKQLNYTITIDEDWFKYKETREFFRNEIQFINRSSRDPLTQWYKYREYEHTLDIIEVVLGLVLDTKVSKDIIKYIITPYII